MAIAQTLLPEFEHEMNATRSLLERVPWERKDWKPHPRASSLEKLATHVANIPAWMAPTIQQSELDLNPGGKPLVVSPVNGHAELLEFFDRNVSSAREALTGASDAAFREMWTLKNNDTNVFTMPKVAVVRSFVMNHLIHHRGQLTVYLRQLDVTLPSVYGPTADT